MRWRSRTIAEVDPHVVNIIRDPNWLAHRYDPGHDAVHFRYITHSERARAAFLTDGHLATADPVVLRRIDAMALAPPSAPIHYIFHSAFCCSTLLARAFDLPGLASTLKEPPILNDIVGWRHSGSVEGTHVAQILDNSLTLLGRPFEAAESVIIKPSNIVNGLADAMLALRPASTALILHAPLSIYLRSIAKKGIEGRLWVRDLLVKLLREGLIDLGLNRDDYLRLTDLQAAAVGWLAQHALFGRLANKYSSRVRTIDSETLLSRPEESIRGLASIFHLSASPEDVSCIVQGPAFSHHSKLGTIFDTTIRNAEYRSAAKGHGDEITKVEIWTEAVAKAANINMTLPFPLLRKDKLDL